MITIYANFDSFENAAKAGGALLDHGFPPEDFSFLAGPSHQSRFQLESQAIDKLGTKVRSGITTTTGADAFEGATEGASAGLVLGALGAVACLFIPGFGIVVGGGALAAAVAAALGTAAGGAAVGGVAGYLRDLGVQEQAAQTLERTVSNEGVVIAVRFQKGGPHEVQALNIFEKYNAGEIHSVENRSHVF